MTLWRGNWYKRKEAGNWRNNYSGEIKANPTSKKVSGYELNRAHSYGSAPKSKPQALKDISSFHVPSALASQLRKRI